MYVQRPSSFGTFSSESDKSGLPLLSAKETGAIQNKLMGVVVLAPPNENLFWAGGSGLRRTDGEAHAAAVNSLVQLIIPRRGVRSGKRLLYRCFGRISIYTQAFFVPAFGAQDKTGVVLNCGALTPQVAVADAATLMTNVKIHFRDEIALLQTAIPKAITAYETLAVNAGISAAQIGMMHTVHNTPNGGGHCGFDGQGFVSVVQLITNLANIMGANPTGQVTGIGNVLKTVVGNEAVVFTSSA